MLYISKLQPIDPKLPTGHPSKAGPVQCWVWGSYQNHTKADPKSLDGSMGRLRIYLQLLQKSTRCRQKYQAHGFYGNIFFKNTSLNTARHASHRIKIKDSSPTKILTSQNGFIKKSDFRVIQSDLLGMAKWPFQRISDLQLGDKPFIGPLFQPTYFDRRGPPCRRWSQQTASLPLKIGDPESKFLFQPFPDAPS